MISRKTQFFSAAVIAAALVATVSLAHTLRPTGPAEPAAHASTNAAHPARSTVGAAPFTATSRDMQPQPHRNFACAAAIEQQCEKADWWPE